MNLEQAYIGCLLCFRQTDRILAMLDPQDLSEEGRGVYEAVRALREQGREVDPVVVIETAGEGLRPYIEGAVLEGGDMHADQCEEHARLITEKAQLRRVKAKALQLVTCAGMGEARQLAAELTVMSQDNDVRDEWSMEALMRETLSALHSKPRYITTGFGKLDKYLLISPGDFIVVGGRPSSGKTAFTLQMAAHMAKTHRVAYFSLETGPEKTGNRLLSTVGGIELDRLLRRKLEGEDDAWRKIASASQSLIAGGLTYIHANGYDAQRIAAKAQRLGAEVVFIDYLGLLQSRGRDRYEQVTNLSVALHNFAQRTGTAVIALCQLNRAGASGRPELHELRESGQIEQDADAVLLLDYTGARKDPPTAEHVVAVAKNKEGSVGDLDFRFFGATQRFYAEDRGVSRGGMRGRDA